ncbi:hypothetical protein C7C45_12995 [Micromonospora arborensis]|uniref:Uncharacterized protein n=1 Tax=Micromonospora arborensis TaxID=2116518 RepID=A0A318NNV3_9ACTN|nr:hypothetical protein C7C45_12995 [Micromonospora arborensis]
MLRRQLEFNDHVSVFGPVGDLPFTWKAFWIHGSSEYLIYKPLDSFGFSERESLSACLQVVVIELCTGVRLLCLSMVFILGRC